MILLFTLPVQKGLEPVRGRIAQRAQNRNIYTHFYSVLIGIKLVVVKFQRAGKSLA